MSSHFLSTFLISLVISIRSAVADYCQGFTNANGDRVEGFQCPELFDDFEEYKCCGPSDDHYCCNLLDYDNYFGYFYWSAGKIIGVVLGGIVGFCLLVVIVGVFCCCYVRNARKQRPLQQMTVRGPQQTTTQPVTTQWQAYPQHGQDYPQNDGDNLQHYDQIYPPQHPQPYKQAYDPRDGHQQLGLGLTSQPSATYPQSQATSSTSRPYVVSTPYPPEVAPPPPSHTY